ncbi:hypothetical protein HS088_TW20G00492 [Tripterygium wilfordii]|uniref:Uncharacterized protein n=1 Tax=Tripterygium wilfordii TaxID=458696 RepID=A0A7J7C7N1_TRIWF|nr:hypothetical protein HS088_TW20G00492 [Tripterygium wilfordii]
MKIYTNFPESKQDDDETNQEPLETNKALDLPHDDQVVVDSNTYNGQDESLPITNGESGRKGDSTNNGNQKSSRKAPTPAKQEHTENVLQSSPTWPSYICLLSDFIKGDTGRVAKVASSKQPHKHF